MSDSLPTAIGIRTGLVTVSAWRLTKLPWTKQTYHWRRHRTCTSRCGLDSMSSRSRWPLRWFQLISQVKVLIAIGDDTHPIYHFRPSRAARGY
jgi:hypothetical protein